MKQVNIVLIALTLTLGCLASGCGKSSDSGAGQSLDSGIADMAGFAGGAIGTIVATCTPMAEICNEKDDDCDGQIDETKDVESQVFDDLDNCGRCGNSCRRPNAITTCRENECVFTACQAGFLDENRDTGNFDNPDADGCETKADCVRTSGGRELCDQSDNDCDGKVDEETNLDSDLKNCGACGVTCAEADNAFVVCLEGQCQLEACEDGWIDLNDDRSDGCEYKCSIRATDAVSEFCNGLDDDCDGVADEGIQVEDTGCGVDGACAPECQSDEDCTREGDRCGDEQVCLPVNAPELARSCENDTDCQVVHPGYACIEVNQRSGNEWLRSRTCVPRTHEPMCDGSRGFRCVRSTLWQAGDEAGRCDGIDNDCDGRVDEDFRQELFLPDDETPRPCETGSGLCRATGVTVCDDLGQGTRCTAIPVEPPSDVDDTCNGIDDDCDGAIDEDYVDVVVQFDTFSIYAYEASRPGATDTLEGLDLTPDDGIKNFVQARPCSRAGVQPWSDVSWIEARNACQSIGARLCRTEEWQRACAGPSDQAYPYGNRVNYESCNGGVFDTDPNTGVDDDSALVCGGVPTCERDGVYDLSGNLKEWIDGGIDNLRSVRGGSFETDLPAGLTCQNDGDYKNINFHHRSIGFRCCLDRAN